MGKAYHAEQRFKPLKGEGKPLWEFKEHDHRLYCLRTVVDVDFLEIVLLDGWVKDKAGKSDEERRQVTHALALSSEWRQSKSKERA